MTTSETLAQEANRVLHTMVTVISKGKEAAPMLVAYGHDRRRWTALLTGLGTPSGDPEGWGKVTDWLARSNADGAVICLDSFIRAVPRAEVDDYLAATSPKNDPAASEALILTVFQRSGTEIRTCAAVRMVYGRADDGTITWGEPDGEMPLTGVLADYVAAGLRAGNENRADAVMAEILAAGCVVIDAKGRRRSP